MVKGKGSKKGKKADRRASTTALNGTTVDEDVNCGDDNDPLDPEDLEYFQDSDRSFAFLQKVVADVPGSGKKRKRKKIEQEEEADYEKRPRTIQTEQGRNERVLLPIKSKDSIIPRTEKIPIVDLQEHTEQTDPVDLLPETIHQSTESPTLPPTLSMVELFNKRRQKLMQRKLRIAELSNSILENPQESVSELQELCKLCDERDTDVRITTKKLAMVSLLTVFKDIVPGYPIRRLTEKEQGVKLSKEVKKLRDFEEGLLKYYQEYLQILETTVEDYSKNRNTTSSNGVLQKNVASESVMLVAVQCMCDLLTSLPHFNFHTNLVAVLVPRMNDKSLDGQVSKLCYNAFVTLFKQDSVGSVSLETVRVISKFVKSKGFRVLPCVLETFLYLRINQLDIQSLKHNNEKKTAVELKIEKNKNRIEKKLKGKMSKKEKKRKREMKKLEKELQETEAVESQQKRAKLQTEILKFVFVTYFRVLKTVGHSPLLSPVLEGLAKFAHLINVDFFSDLMAALHDLLNNGELSLRETLNCVLTAIKILSGQGEALNIDPRGFYNTLYTKLLQVHVGFSSEDVPVVLQCLEEMLKKRRKQSHTKVQAILDSESMGTGLFRPDVNDPELSNADSTTAWELALLETGHYHPAVRIAAHHVAEGAPSKGQFSTMMRMSPLEFWEQYDSSDMKLNPDMVENAQNRKEVNFKRIKHMKEGDWKSCDIELSIKAALDFTEASSVEVVFSLPVNAAER